MSIKDILEVVAALCEEKTPEQLGLEREVRREGKERKIIGSNPLALSILKILAQPELLLNCKPYNLADALSDLERSYRGASISDYIKSYDDQPFWPLDDLLNSAKNLVDYIMFD